MLANFFSFVKAAAAITSGAFAFGHQWRYALLFLLLAVCLEMVDGAIARSEKTASEKGNAVDVVTGFLIPLSGMVGLWLGGSIPGFLLATFLAIFALMAVGVNTVWNLRATSKLVNARANNINRVLFVGAMVCISLRYAQEGHFPQILVVILVWAVLGVVFCVRDPQRVMDLWSADANH